MFTGLTHEMKNDFRVMKDVGVETIQNPSKKFSILIDGSKKINNKIVYQITQNPIEVQGKQLDYPVLMLDKKKTTQLKKERIFVDKPFKEIKIEDNWVFLYHFRHKRDVGDILNKMLKEAQGRKISLHQPCFMHEISDKITKQECLKLIKQNTKKKPKIIFFLLDRKSNHLYETFKLFFNQKGMFTQFCTKLRIPRDL